MKNFLTLALIAGAISAKHLSREEKEQRKLDQKEFTEYMKNWGKDYKSKEEKQEHMEKWKESKKVVDKLNGRKTRAHFEVNEMSDLSPEEQEKRKGIKKQQGDTKRHEPSKPTLPEHAQGEKGHDRGGRKLSDHNAYNFNWAEWIGKEAGYQVRNQGSCGSCWAFAANAVQEIMQWWYGSDDNIHHLSIQEVLNCNFQNAHCEGGWMEYAWDISAAQGSQLDSVYPYEGYQWSTVGRWANCPGVYQKKVASKARDYGTLPFDLYGDNVSQLSYYLYWWGPMAITVQAADQAFWNYQGGIVTVEDLGYPESSKDEYLFQNPDQFWYDHAVTLVGQGVTEDGLQYWIIQNSWGDWWGEAGYIRVAKEAGRGIFGMNMIAQWMDVESGYPKALYDTAL